jgi:hypothetical protein
MTGRQVEVDEPFLRYTTTFTGYRSPGSLVYEPYHAGSMGDGSVRMLKNPQSVDRILSGT